MAENEYLDSTKARRWHSVVQVIRDGGSVEEVADSVEECFFKTLRQIRKDLPLADMIRAMENPDELMRVARSTVSCVSYPLRHRTRKSCGLCAACLFRRVALNAAGIDEARGTYQSDVLDHHSLSPKKLNYLKAFLNQIDSLAETDAGRLPVSLSKHLYQTGLVERGGSLEVYVELYRKYRREWLAFVTKAKLNGCQWANLIDLPQKAA